MKIFVLTIVDIKNYGFCPKDVEVFTDKESAKMRMRELYEDRARKQGFENPFSGDNNIDYAFEDDYSYVWDELYLDIFEREIDTEVKVVENKEQNYLIDRDGLPYVENESWPAGGGLDSRCDYNGVALHCFYDIEDMDKIHEVLKNAGFDDPIHSDEGMEIWEKGNTRIVFEDYDVSQWGYVHTEYIDLGTPTEEEEEPFKIDHNKTTTMYGFAHYEVPTDYAKKSIETNTFDGSSDLYWWKVAVLPNGDEIWEDNSMGVILILTKEKVSYFRYI